MLVSTSIASTAPVVTNANYFASESARLGGVVLDTGGINPTVHIYWGTSDGGTTVGSWQHDENLGIQPQGAFHKDITGLSPSYTYYFRCYAVNTVGSAWADGTTKFITQSLPGAPSVSNSYGASNIAYSSARLNGLITATGGENPTVRIHWGTTDNGTAAANWQHNESLGVLPAGAFYEDINGLSGNTTYYYRCYAANPGGSAWANNTSNFTITNSPMPLVGSNDNGPWPYGAGLDYFDLIQYKATSSGIINDFRVKTSGSGHVKVAVYADSSGAPGALLSRSDNAGTAVSAGWNNISIDETTITKDNYYWLAFDADANIVCYNYSSSWPLSWYGKTAIYSSFTFPQTAGTGFGTWTGYAAAVSAWYVPVTSKKLVGTADNAYPYFSGSGWFALNEYKATSSGIATVYRVKTSGSGHVKVAVYADSSGAPGALLSRSDNAGTAVSTGWNNISIPATIINKNSHYWLAFIADSDIICYTYESDYPMSWYGKTATYSSFTYPSTAGGGFTTWTGYHAALALWDMSIFPTIPNPYQCYKGTKNLTSFYPNAQIAYWTPSTTYPDGYVALYTPANESTPAKVIDPFLGISDASKYPVISKTFDNLTAFDDYMIYVNPYPENYSFANTSLTAFRDSIKNASKNAAISITVSSSDDVPIVITTDLPYIYSIGESNGQTSRCLIFPVADLGYCEAGTLALWQHYHDLGISCWIATWTTPFWSNQPSHDELWIPNCVSVRYPSVFPGLVGTDPSGLGNTPYFSYIQEWEDTHDNNQLSFALKLGQEAGLEQYLGSSPLYSLFTNSAGGTLIDSHYGPEFCDQMPTPSHLSATPAEYQAYERSLWADVTNLKLSASHMKWSPSQLEHINSRLEEINRTLDIINASMSSSEPLNNTMQRYLNYGLNNSSLNLTVNMNITECGPIGDCYNITEEPKYSNESENLTFARFSPQRISIKTSPNASTAARRHRSQNNQF